MYQALLLNAAKIQKEPLLERIQIGRRLLSVSREMLYRMNVLGMIYLIDKGPAVLKRIDEEVLAVSLVIAENDPELAAETIRRVLEGMPYALVEYGPDGVYPEDSTYYSTPDCE